MAGEVSWTDTFVTPNDPRIVVERDCTCGSGAHPRRCEKHPWGYDMHRHDLNLDTTNDNLDELTKRVEAIEARYITPADKPKTLTPQEAANGVDD